MKANIEEYKELRAEIRHYLSDFYRIRRFAYFITIGIIAFGFSSQNTSILFFFGAIMVLFIWQEQLRTLRNVFRVATYIEIFIESNDNSLRWETLSSNHSFDLSDNSKFSRVIADLDLPLLYLLNSIIGINKIWNQHFTFSVILILLMGSIFAFQIYNTIKTIDIGKTEERNNWIELKKSIIS